MHDEKALMQAVQQGQLDKLSRLFENNHVALFNYFLRTGNSRAVSEDLVQDTFMKVLTYRHSYNGSGSFRSWLFGIARNTMADHYRKGAHERNHQDVDETSVATAQTLTDDLARDQQQDLFDRALAMLPADLREILVLSRFHQFNYEDIASLQGVNLNTLKSRMRKAIQLLQQNYQLLNGEAA